MPYKHGVTGSIPVVPTISPAAIKVTLRKKKHGPVVQLVRTPACHAGGRRFEPVLGRQGMQKCPFYASVAQLVEQRTENPRVVGSIPTGGTTPIGCVLHPMGQPNKFYAGVAHLAERHLAKVEVASSNLVARSNVGVRLHSTSRRLRRLLALHPAPLFSPRFLHAKRKGFSFSTVVHSLQKLRFRYFFDG